MNNFPIGIFDSGMGGLTVARAIRQKMPGEHLIYFGDTAHCPWGDKSVTAIEHYATEICDFLIQNQCKVIVVACNTASALAWPAVIRKIQNRVPVFNVIDPVVEYLKNHHTQQRVGLIGTRQTIHSQHYTKKVAALKAGIQLFSQATPLLVPLIEEGFMQKAATSLILHEYLSTPHLLNIQALILGCTHYPLLKKDIDAFYDHKVDIIDSAEMTAEKLAHWLCQNQCQAKRAHAGEDHFYVSDLTETFSQTAKLFFPELTKLELCELWLSEKHEQPKNYDERQYREVK